MQKINTLCPAQSTVTDEKRLNVQQKVDKIKQQKVDKTKQQTSMNRTTASSSAETIHPTKVIQHNQCNLNIKQLDGTSLRQSFDCKSFS